jgi:hypothetical protein
MPAGCPSYCVPRWLESSLCTSAAVLRWTKPTGIVLPTTTSGYIRACTDPRRRRHSTLLLDARHTVNGISSSSEGAVDESNEVSTYPVRVQQTAMMLQNPELAPHLPFVGIGCPVRCPMPTPVLIYQYWYCTVYKILVRTR